RGDDAHTIDRLGVGVRRAGEDRHAQDCAKCQRRNTSGGHEVTPKIWMTADHRCSVPGISIAIKFYFWWTICPNCYGLKMQWKDRIGRRLKLQDMHILLATVESGSMAKAAEHLAISQPVVSRAIAGLEHTLGVRLLDRSRSGVEPTLYGRALLTHGLAAFNELKRGVNAIESLADPTAGELRIGSTETMAAGLLGAIIEELSAKYPRLTIHVTLGYPPEMQDRELRTRTVDLIIGRVPALVPPEDTDVEVLFDDKLHVVASAQNRWTRRRRFKLLDLMN